MLPFDMPSLEDIERIAQIAAILVGGLWAYFRFFKARTLKPRLGLHLSAHLVQTDSRKYVHVFVSAKNLGITRIDLDLTKCRGFLFLDRGSGPRTEWSMLAYFPILQNHEWIESDEEDSEEQLIPLPGFPRGAMKLEIFVCSKGYYHPAAWEASTIVIATEGENGHGTDYGRQSAKSHQGVH
jgi:hypothetical protein